MTYLMLALLFSTLIMVNFKLYPRMGINALQAIVVNYLTAFVCGYLSTPLAHVTKIITAPWLYTAILSGFFLITVFLVFSKSAAKAGIAITSVSSKMSVIIPVLLGLFLFDEVAGWMRIMGIILAFPAFVLIFSHREKGHKVKKSFFFLPLLLFLGNGTNDSLFKFAQFHFLQSDTDVIHYLTVAFGISLLLGLFFIFFKIIFSCYHISTKSLIAGIFLGLLNWYSTYFFLAGLSIINVSVFIPVFNLGIVIMGSLTGILIFGEKVRLLNLAGFVLACIAIYLIVAQ